MMNTSIHVKKSNSELSEILEYIDIESWLDYEGVEYKVTFGRSGDQANIKTCPRCGGSDWKVYLGLETGVGNCFHGACVGEPFFNIYTFALAYLEKSPKKTIQSLKDFAKRSGYKVKKKSRIKTSEYDVKLPTNYKIPIDGKNLKYLSNRGFDNEICQYFDWRYVSSGSYLYKDHNNALKYQRYDGRILIPIYDLQGELKTFQGRDITGESSRKYLFPPGLTGSGRFLYNGLNAIHAETVIISEGVFDVAAVKMAMDEVSDLRDVIPIGTFGKSLSMANEGASQLSDFMTLKSNGLKRVVFMWDGEKSAIKSAFDSAIQLQSRTGLNCSVAILPHGCDPNETSSSKIRKAYYNAICATKSNAIKTLLNYRIT